MGCVQSTGSLHSPPTGRRNLERGHVHGRGGNVEKPIGQRQQLSNKDSDPDQGKLLKHELQKKGAVVVLYGASVGDEKVAGGREVAKKVDLAGGNASTRVVLKKIEAEELVNGWPKWLADNICGEVLAGLARKSADSYEKLAKVGHGTYSNVYKARDRDTGKIVALKKVRFDTSEAESVKFMAREIMMLQKLDHPNIIKLEGLATSRMQYSLYLVFDYMQSDLTRIISRPGERLTEPQVKCYMQQLLAGLQHCHDRGILHRDIKASNLLIDRNGVLKIADFGLANFFLPKPKRALTSRVVTLWYRAPELLLGSADYGVGIDLWSAGCLLAEMFIGRPILPGRTEVEQLHRIFKLCGSPPEDYWKIMRLPTSFRPPQHYKPSFQEAFRDLPESSLPLLTTLLSLNPAYRGNAASALQSHFFNTSPLACQLSELPVIQREETEPTQTKDRKKRRISYKKKPSSESIEDEQKMIHIARRRNEDRESSKELEKNLEWSDIEAQEARHSGSSSTISSSLKPVTEERSVAQSFSPIRRSQEITARRTEAHPNATKNIKNYTLLQASIMDIVKHNGGNNNGMPGFRKSLSTLDYRTLDLDNISKLCELEKD